MSAAAWINDAADFVDVAGEGQGGYAWSQIEVWYSPSRRRYFWYSDAGCSCTYFGEDVHGLDDLSNGTKADAIEALRQWRAGLDTISKAQAFTPPASS